MENRHIVTVNIFMVNAENLDETVNYLAERAQEIRQAALERAQREVVEPAEPVEPEEDNDVSSSSNSDSDGWGTEFEELVCEVHRVHKVLNSKQIIKAEKWYAKVRAEEEYDKVKKEVEQLEEECEQKQKYMIKHCEEIMAMKKRKTIKT